MRARCTSCVRHIARAAQNTPSADSITARNLPHVQLGRRCWHEEQRRRAGRGERKAAHNPRQGRHLSGWIVSAKSVPATHWLGGPGGGMPGVRRAYLALRTLLLVAPTPLLTLLRHQYRLFKAAEQKLLKRMTIGHLRSATSTTLGLKASAMARVTS